MATIGTLNINLTASTATFASGMRAAEASLRSLGSTVSKVKPILSTLGLGLGIGGVVMAARSMVTAGARFEHSMQGVKAITGATGAGFDALKTEAERLGRDTKFSASEAAQGMEILGQAGLDTGTILTAMEPTFNLAAAGGIEIAQAADVAVSAMSGMGIAADRLQGVVDVLAKASSASNTDVLGLGEALKMAGPTAKLAGFGIEQTVAAVEALSQVGIKGEEAGTALQQVITKLADKTPQAQEALKQLGIETLDASGNIRSISDLVDEFNGALAGMGSGAKLEALSTIFDARAARSFAAMMGLGGDALRKFENELRNSAGEAAKQAETRMDDLSGSWENFTSSIEGLSITISKYTEPMLRTVVDFATNAVNVFNSMFPPIMAVFDAYLGAVAEFWGAVWDGIVSVTGISMTGIYNTVGREMHGMTDLVIGLLATIEYSFAHWQDALIIAGLAVRLGVVTLGNQIAYVFTEVIPTMLDWLGKHWEEVFYTIVDFTATVFINMGQNIRDAMSAIYDYISDFGASDFTFVWTPLTEGFRSAIRELPEIAEREMGATELALSNELSKEKAAFGKGMTDFAEQRIGAFHEKQAAAGGKAGGAAAKLNVPDIEAKAPAGIGGSKGNAALEYGSAEAFHASFGGKSTGQTLAQMLNEAKQLTKLQQKAQRDIERQRLLQEKNNVKPAAFGFGGGGGGF